MMRNPNPYAAAAVAAFLIIGPVAAIAQRVAPVLDPSPLPEMTYGAEFFPGANHDPAVPTIDSLLGFREGARAATTAEVERCLDAWATASPRVRVIEYARTHEGRPLHYVVISDPANLKRLGEIKAGLAKLADPRTLANGEADRLIDSLPGVAWIAYTIHGDETEGTDAALAVIHHLAAARDKTTAAMLRDLVVLIDPVMNPDGRDRFLKMIAEARGAHPNVDDQSLVHGGYWPWGRTNHYGFDMNRDWIHGTQPETVGRWKVIAEWNPQFVVDSHGMGAQDSFLFSPPRAPHLPHLPASASRWGDVFSRDQAEAFDRQGWTYYSGEWNEGWFPGYSDAWPALRGAVGVLYEQARMADAGVRRAEGTIQSYREAVHGNVVSTMANLATFHRNAKELRREFHAHRVAALDPRGPFGARSWAILPTANRGRLQAFTSCLAQQGIEMRILDEPMSAAAATDLLGRELENATLPAGTIVIPNRQPLGHLAATLLEFDLRIPDESLKHEREELLKKGDSSIYDLTAWNLAMLHGLEALSIPADLGAAGRPHAPPATGTVAAKPAASTVGWVADGADDASVVFAARLMEQGVQVRVSDKASAFDGAPHARGSVVVMRRDNRLFQGDLATRVAAIAAECGVELQAIRSGQGAGDLPDLGGGHFHLLTRPRVAVLARGRSSPNDFGTIWHLLDHSLAIRSSQLSADHGGHDLRRYNVIIVPHQWAGQVPEGLAGDLKTWVEAGGTLIATAGASGFFSREKSAIGKTRSLPDALEEVEPFRQQVLREWLAARAGIPDDGAVWSRDVPGKIDFPWKTGEKNGADSKELKRRDQWQKLFMPQGAILAGRVDTDHWLTSGAGAVLPILAMDGPVLLAPGGVESPVRFGVWEAVEVADEKAETTHVGWSAMPAGSKLTLRVSGLLWPEAAQRIANSAYVTREGVGKGQVILFAGQPTFRAATPGTQRLLMNAIVHGPGIGASSPIIP